MSENNENPSPSTPRTKSKRKSDLGADPKDLTDPPVLTPIPKQPRRSYSLYKKLEYIRYYEQECFGNKCCGIGSDVPHEELNHRMRNILINNLSDQEQWDYLRPRVEEDEDDDEQFSIDQATAGDNALVDLSDSEDDVDDDDDA